MFQKTFQHRKITNRELIDHLNTKGRHLVLKLYKVFSFKKPKTYNIFERSKITEKNYKEDEKLIMSLISIIQKYNKFLNEKKSLFLERKQINNKFLSEYHIFHKNFNKNFNNNNQLQYIINSYLPKYAKKGIFFKTKFLHSNLFKDSVLLSTNKNQIIDYIDKDIQLNGANSYHSIKIVYFIENLYKQIEEYLNLNFIGRKRLNDEKFNKLNNDNEKEKKILTKSNSELDMIQLNKYLREKNEIKLNELQIEKLKNLIEVAEKEYMDFFENEKDSGYNSKNNSSILKSNNSKTKITNFELKKVDSNKKLYKQQSMEKSLSIFDKSGSTLTTKYPKDNESYFLSPISNKKNKIEFNEATSRKITLKNKSRNNFNLTSQKNLSSNDENNEIKDNYINYLLKNRKSSNNDKDLELNKNHITSRYNNKRIKFIINSFDKDEKLSDDFNKKRRLKRGATLRINRCNNQNLNFYVRKNRLPTGKLRKHFKKIRDPPNIPHIYEELKKCKNIFSFSQKNFANENLQNKVNNLFLEMYDQEKIDEFNTKNSPIDLYKSFYKIRYRIERQENDYKRLYGCFSDSVKQKLNESAYQDEELKNRYKEFVQIMINKNIIEDNQ